MKWIESLAQDRRYAMRGLRRTPVVTTVAVLSLAIGVGATTAVFTLANVMLLKPLPFPEPDRLVVAYQTATRPGFGATDTVPWSVARYQRLADLVPAFETVGFAAWQDMNIRPEFPNSPVERVRVEIVSASAIEALRVTPYYGRRFQRDEDEPGTPYTAGLISYRLWRRRVADYGETVNLHGAPMTVVGIMPESFTGFGAGADIWIPLHAMPRIQGGPQWTERLGNQVGTVIARVRPDVAISVVAAQMTVAAQALSASIPERFAPSGSQWGAGVIGLQEARRHPLVRPLLRILAVAVGAVLLIVCANLAGLLLARAHARRTEIRIRLALGARRSRIARQLLTESVLLAGLGALPGLGIAYVGAEALASLRPKLPPTFVLLRGTDLLEGVSLLPDWRVLAFMAGLTIAVGLGFGSVPAIAAARMRTRVLLSGEMEGGGRGASRGRSVLVIGQVALATMLLIGAGLMGRSFRQLVQTDLGFEFRGTTIMRLASTDTSAAAAARRDVMLERIADIPLVEGVATQSCVPFDRECLFRMPLHADGQTPLEAARAPEVQVHTVSADYFRVLRIPIIEGRGFALSEESGTSTGVIISASAARRLWRDGRSPIGRLVEAHGPSQPRSEVIGIVGDTKFETIEGPAGAALYRSSTRSSDGGPQYGAALIIRSAADAGRLIPLVAGEVTKADPSIAISGVATGVELVAAAASSTRFIATLLGAFAILAAFLAAIGIYGVLTYMVALRAREYGIRMAIGASATWVVGDVVKHGLFLTASGLALGIGGALGATTILTRFLYDVARADAITYAAITLVIGAVGATAALIPAWRATRVDPAAVLRD